jgi:hypothetical protein
VLSHKHVLKWHRFAPQLEMDREDLISESNQYQAAAGPADGKRWQEVAPPPQRLQRP